MLSKVKAVNSIYFHFYFHFHFPFDLFCISLLLELRVRVKVIRSCCYISVISDDTVTDHET